MNMKGITAMICTAALMMSCGNADNIEQKVNQLYDSMSQEERIAQLRSGYMDELFDENGKLDTAKCKQQIPYGIGHFSQYASQELVDANLLRERVAIVQDWLMHHTPHGIPALFHEEVLSGINTMDATIYPQQIGQACSFNPELAELKTYQTGTELRKMGGVLSLSPMVDVCRTPSFNRLEESYGEDGYLSAVLGTAFVKGLQQGDLKKGVGACSKHYLGYGGGGDADEKEMMEEILLPHEAMIRLAGSKVIIAAVGENVMLCGENREREGLRLPGKQEEYVEELLATGKPVVLVVFGGRAQIISKIAKRCAAVIQAWYPGEEGGTAVADILYGKVSPSAKLSVSYPNTEVNEPICYNYSAKRDPRVEWPFGYGLSYTTFEYENLQTVQEISTSSESSNLYFEVTNTGKVKADEVAQVYLSPTDVSQKIRPIQLQGFARISLNPGETRRVCIKFYTDQFGHYSHEGKRQWNIEPGTYELKIGASSEDIKLRQRIVLKGDKVVKPLRDYYFSEVVSK